MSENEESTSDNSESNTPELEYVGETKFNRIKNGNARVRIKEPQITENEKGNDEELPGKSNAIQATENVDERYAEIARLRKKYIHSEGRTVHTHKFFFKDRENTLAFETKKNMVQSGLDESYVTKDMVRYAVNNGWSKISIEGSEKFKSEVWHDASLKGVEVKGYHPTELDRAKLINSQHLETSKPPLSESSRASVSEVKNVLRKRGDSEVVIDAVGSEAEKRLSGKNFTIGHVENTGYAQFKERDKHSKTYFVDMKTNAGDKRLWGTHLKELVKRGLINKGEEIAIEHKGKQPTQVPERDENGKETGVWIAAERNEYAVYDLAKVDPARAKEMRSQDRNRTSEPQIGRERNINENERDAREVSRERSVAVER